LEKGRLKKEELKLKDPTRPAKGRLKLRGTNPNEILKIISAPNTEEDE
jgi:hypothetical protein